MWSGVGAACLTALLATLPIGTLWTSLLAFISTTLIVLALNPKFVYRRLAFATLSIWGSAVGLSGLRIHIQSPDFLLRFIALTTEWSFHACAGIVVTTGLILDYFRTLPKSREDKPDIATHKTSLPRGLSKNARDTTIAVATSIAIITTCALTIINLSGHHYLLIAISAGIVATTSSAAYWSHRSRTKDLPSILQQIPEEERLTAVAALSEVYALRTDNLTRQQRYDLLNTTIQLRARRSLVYATIFAACFLALVLLLMLTSFAKSESNESANLKYRTTAIENHYLTYNAAPWPFPVDPDGADITHPLNPLRLREGLVTSFPVASAHPRIPEREVFVDFTLANHGKSLAVVDEILVEIIERHPMPAGSLLNQYLPGLKAEKDSVTLTSNQDTYSVFSRDGYKYGPSEVDKFRLKVACDDTTKGQVLRFRISTRLHSAEGHSTVASDRDYLLANFGGSNERTKPQEPIEPEIDDRPPNSPTESRVTPIQVEAELLKRRAWGLAAQGKWIRNNFDACIDHISESRLHEACASIEARIDRIRKFEDEGVRLLDGGPDEGSCRMLRVFLRAAQGDAEGAAADYAWLRPKLAAEPSDEARKSLDFMDANGVTQIQQALSDPDIARIELLSMARRIANQGISGSGLLYWSSTGENLPLRYPETEPSDYQQLTRCPPGEAESLLSRANRVMKLSTDLASSGAFAKAIDYAKEALRMATRARGSVDRDVAMLTTLVGAFYHKAGNDALGASFAESALDLFSKLPDPNLNDANVIHMNYISACESRGDKKALIGSIRRYRDFLMSYEPQSDQIFMRVVRLQKRLAALEESEASTSPGRDK